MVYLYALTTGVLIILSLSQNAKLADHTSILQSTIINYITGLFGAIIAFIIAGESLSFIFHLDSVPLLGYFGGLLGIIVVAFSSIIVRKISLIASTMLMYTGQLLAGIIIDLLRGTELSIGKIIGCILIFIGIYINTVIDNSPISSHIKS